MNMILNFNINIGDLNEVKKQKIQEIFKLDFPGAVSLPNQLVLTGNGEQIILTPIQMQYSCNHEYFEKIQANIIKIKELLMLEQVINTMTVIITDLKDIEGKAMNYTKEKFSSLISDSLGVGKREFFLYNQVLSEVKVEPFVNDDRKIYIEALYNVNAKPMSNIIDVLNDIKLNYNKKKEEIFKNLE